MIKRFASFLLLLPIVTPALSRAQDAQPTVSRTGRFFSHFDLGVSGVAFLTKDVNGTVTGAGAGTPYPVTQSASSAAGVLATIRVQKSAWKGGEFNYGYGRTTQSYTCCNTNATTGASAGPFASQAKVNEYTVGYLARPDRTILGFKPYVSGGLGVMAFGPTAYGGQSLQPQARMTYYYSVGGEEMLTQSFGVRFGLRQLFYKAPDFDQNYLRIKKTTFTVEPQIGIFYHF